MPKGYTHLTKVQRYQISALDKRNIPPSEIAGTIGVHRSTVYRELKRSITSKGQVYSPSRAHKDYCLKRQNSGGKSKIDGPIKAYILAKLAQNWSPEQIAGRIKIDSPDLSIHHETIYRYIGKNRKNGGNLYRNLLYSGKKYAKRGSKTQKRSLIPGRIDISQRPQIVEEKTRIGDWEGDLIIGASGSGALATLVDRASKYVRIGFIPSKKAYDVRCKIQDMMADIKDKILTITFDNDTEFSDHAAIQSALGTDIYFATPYHSWERGLNEHTNGLIRKFFPKKLPFQDTSDQNIQCVQNALNNRPRKVLNFKTPNEVFFSNTS